MFDIQENTFKDHWKNIAEEYINLNEQYILSANDAAFWHFEITCTAMLATASWRSGIPALCETYTGRTKLSGKRGRSKSSDGRADIYLSCPSGDEWVEAKKAAQSVDPTECSIFTERSIIALLHKAREDSRTLRNYVLDDDFHVSMGFMGFSLPAASNYGRGQKLNRKKIALAAVETLQRACEAFPRPRTEIFEIGFCAAFSTASDMPEPYGDGYRAFGLTMFGIRERGGDLAAK